LGAKGSHNKGGGDHGAKIAHKKITEKKKSNRDRLRIKKHYSIKGAIVPLL
jgi:hypothetical protein